ncbi:hypothetical protein HED60_03165 [Planctomycetales bacterium ZRK34]|nr:hypothetical protein HED60_03165 [Planctomycetales bacterium ZRK34]
MDELIAAASLDELMCRFFEADCTADVAEELNRRLRDDPSARQQILAVSRMCVLLNETMADTQGESIDIAPAVNVARHGVSAVWYAAAAVLVVAGIISAMLFLTPRADSDGESVRPAQHIALLTNMSDAVFTDDGQAVALGSTLTAGRLSLLSGSAQVMFDSGAVVDMTGPCVFRMTGPNRGELMQGALSVYVPRQARGFAVGAPGDVLVVDLGTRFFMQVDAQGACHVAVLEGQVQIERPHESSRRLTRGQIAHVPSHSTRPVQIRNVHDQTLGQTWHGDPALLAQFDFTQTPDEDGAVTNHVPSGGRPAMLEGITPTLDAATGRFAAPLDGVDDAIAIDLPGHHEALTLAMWVWIDELDRQVNALMLSDSRDAGHVHWQIRRDRQMVFDVLQQTRVVAPIAPSVQLTGRWCHVAAVYDAVDRSAAVYLDGRMIGQTKIAVSAPAYIGKAHLGSWAERSTGDLAFSDRHLRGRIAGFVALGRAATNDEILRLYHDDLDMLDANPSLSKENHR